MKKITVRWQSTETYAHTGDVPDDFDPEGADMDSFLAGLENGSTFEAIVDRQLLEWTVEPLPTDLTRPSRPPVVPRRAQPSPPDPLGGPIPGLYGSVLPE